MIPGGTTMLKTPVQLEMVPELAQMRKSFPVAQSLPTVTSWLPVGGADVESWIPISWPPLVGTMRSGPLTPCDVQETL